MGDDSVSEGDKTGESASAPTEIALLYGIGRMGLKYAEGVEPKLIECKTSLTFGSISSNASRLQRNCVLREGMNFGSEAEEGKAVGGKF